MLTIKKESAINNDLFNAPEKAVVVTVNVVGAMGRGIALSCKKRYPDLYKRYYKDCKAGLFDYKKIGVVHMDRPILLVPTKKEFWNPSDFKHILYLCSRLPKACDHWGIESVAIPPMGMVNGWLKKEAIVSIVEKLKEEFSKSKVEGVLYLPDNLYELL